MKPTSIFILLLFIFCSSVFSQRAADHLISLKRYNQSEVLDSSGSINLYTKLIGALGGDSTTFNRQGYDLQGWNEYFYTSGKMLHRGYYVNGKLITFKNFFESGQCERSLENPDPLHCNMFVYFENGQLRKQVNYYNGLPQKTYEYYSNGQPKSVEENEKEMRYLTLKKSWYDNGHLKSNLELIDRKNKRYGEKRYYFNGQVKEEGMAVLLSATHEYVKEGVWYSYDSDGSNKTSEKHHNGVKVNPK